MLEVEIGDVDPLRAERLGDARDHAWAVRHVDPETLQRARVVVGGLEQPAAVA